MKYGFPSREAYKTGAYSDFTAITIYAADVFLIISSCFALKSWLKWLKGQKILFLLVIWLILDLFLVKGGYETLNYYFFLRFFLAFVAYETSLVIFGLNTLKPSIIKGFIILSAFQAGIALLQFISQKSVGLYKLGEQVLSSQILGVAKVVSGGTTYIRGYGTQAHPNLLSAFLLAGIFLNIWVLFRENNAKLRAWWLISLIIQIFGVVSTFSRASWLAMAVGIVFLILNLLLSKSFRKIHGKILVVAAAACLAAGLVFLPFLSSRITIKDQSSLERIFYSRVGLKILKDKYFLGTGMGESVLHMQQYSPVKLWPWQIQPVHNYFLLSAVEMGLAGSVLLIIFFFWHFYLLYKKSRTPVSANNELILILQTILLSFFVLMLFDHYFYTLPPTQYMLWVILGWSMAEIKTVPA